MPAALQTSARRDGDHYVLNGTKRFITNAPRGRPVHGDGAHRPGRARARAASRPSWSKRGTPGISIGKPDKKMGQQGAHICDVMFEDCRVPAEALIGGKEGEGFKTAMKVLDRGRLHIAAVCVGVAERLIDESRAPMRASASSSASRSPSSS